MIISVLCVDFLLFCSRFHLSSFKLLQNSTTEAILQLHTQTKNSRYPESDQPWLVLFWWMKWNFVPRKRETLAQYFVSFSTSSWWWWWWHVNNKQRLKKKRIIIMIISPLDSMIVNDGSNNVLNRPETLVVCVLDHRKKWKEQIFVCIFRCF